MRGDAKKKRYVPVSKLTSGCTFKVDGHMMFIGDMCYVNGVVWIKHDVLCQEICIAANEIVELLQTADELEAEIKRMENDDSFDLSDYHDSL